MTGDELLGVVDVRVTGRGSKSEMTTVVLLPDAAAGQEGPPEPVPLRRREAQALDAEAELAAYAGQRVRLTGRRGWSTFVVDTIARITDPAPAGE